jgi:hypothetical protein
LGFGDKTFWEGRPKWSCREPSLNTRPRSRKAMLLPSLHITDFIAIDGVLGIDEYGCPDACAPLPIFIGLPGIN